MASAFLQRGFFFKQLTLLGPPCSARYEPDQAVALNALLQKGRAMQKEEKNAERPTDVTGQEVKKREVEAEGDKH